MAGTPPKPISDEAAMEKVKAMFSYTEAIDEESSKNPMAFPKHSWGGDLFLKELELIAATSQPGSTTYTFTVAARHCNRLNNLHGGCTATIFDICTTTALTPISTPGWAFSGVSRTLNVTYLRPAPEGTKVIVYSEVVHAGKRLATISGVMKRADDGAVLAICEHGKVSIDATFAKI